MAHTTELYIGLMSGTSMDSIDAALVEFNNNDTSLRLIDAIEYDFPAELREQLLSLSQPGPNEIDRMGEADRALGDLFSETVDLLLKQSKTNATDVTAIGSHGQTIRHRPEYNHPFTLQIGDPNTIAQRTQITTIADFRRRDMVLGGQGAPLVPAFHEAILKKPNESRQVVNIGGISNVTRIGDEQNDTVGYDIGPGNGLMDQWIHQCQNKRFDQDGSWAKTGKPNTQLLDLFLADPYFSLPSPKSTGKELFNLEWIDRHLKQLDGPTPKDADVQATLLELTAKSIAMDIEQYGYDNGDVIICGGGVKNSALMTRLTDLLPNHAVQPSDAFNISSQYMEAMAFAWLAMRCIKNLPGNLPAVTGASTPAILGGIYPKG